MNTSTPPTAYVQPSIFPDTYGAHPDDTLERSVAARDAGMAMVESGHPGAMARATVAIIGMIGAGKLITADDVADIIPEVVDSAPNVIGTAFSLLSRQHVIEVVGFDRSHRKSRHAGGLRRWGKGPEWNNR